MAGLALVLSGCKENGISFMFPFGTVAAHQRTWFFSSGLGVLLAA